MKLEIVRRVAMLLILIVSVICFDSVLAIAVSYVFSLWFDYFIIIYPAKRLTGLRLTEHLGAVYKIAIASILMAIAVFLIGQINLRSWLLLLIQIPSGICIYILLCQLLKIDSYHDLLNKIKSK